MTTPHARRSLKAYSCFICPIAAFSATSSTRFFGSPTAMLPCPDSDPLPASSVACSRLATASLPASGSHPSRRTLPSSHRSCVSPAPHPPPLAPLQGGDHLRFRVPAPRHAYSPFFLINHMMIMHFTQKEGTIG